MKRKSKANQIKRLSARTYIRKLLNEAGFPKGKRFQVKREDGRLVVRFNNKKYD